MTDPGDSCGPMQEVAEELTTAAAHLQTAAAHYTATEIPRGAAHAWAAQGHLLRAQEILNDLAKHHSLKSSPLNE
jgi:hypothetical protein